ncbi:MAG: hypothetical protein LAO19_12990 [Acidobacteriia bacterium]|nr:hypothetical protein [Terriglobia bacterium]
MRIGLFAVFVLASALLLVSTPVLAHHGASGYDMDKDTVLKGTITQFEWTNPHGRIALNVVDAGGATQEWVVECGPPSRLVEIGWTRHSLNAGDHVTLHFHGAKNGAPRGILIKVVLEDGKQLENRA